MAKPARSIHKKGRKRVIGSFNSAKMRQSIEWESQIERDFLYHLEFDDDVKSYISQPIRYRYSIDNKYHYHFPDFEIVRRSTSKRKFVEIKPFHVTQKPEFQEITSAIKAKMLSDGFDYVVVTDSQIRIEPIFSNLKLLYRYILHEYNEENMRQLINQLSELGYTSLAFSELRKTAEDFSLELIDCYSAIANKVLSFDASHPLSEDTILTLSRSL